MTNIKFLEFKNTIKEVLCRIKFQLNFIVKRDPTEEENKINKILEYAGIKEI